MDFDTHDRKDLPDGEGHEGRVERFEGEISSTGSRHSPVQTEILGGGNKSSISSLTPRSYKVNGALYRYPTSRRSSCPSCRCSNAHLWLLQRWLRCSVPPFGPHCLAELLTLRLQQGKDSRGYDILRFATSSGVFNDVPVVQLVSALGESGERGKAYFIYFVTMPLDF